MGWPFNPTSCYSLSDRCTLLSCTCASLQLVNTARTIQDGQCRGGDTIHTWLVSCSAFNMPYIMLKNEATHFPELWTKQQSEWRLWNLFHSSFCARGGVFSRRNEQPVWFRTGYATEMMIMYFKCKICNLKVAHCVMLLLSLLPLL